MLKKLLFTSLFCLFTIISFSQQRRFIVNGKVTDSLSTVKNANIINLKTNQGTFSNDNGEFRVFAREGDSLRVSSVQHFTNFVIVNKENINQKKVRIRIKFKTVVLDEFELKRNNLSGSLDIDSKNVPANKKDSILRDLLDFSDINFNANFPIDEIERTKPPIANTDPTATFVGINLGFLIPSKHLEKRRALRKQLAIKKEFPYKIMSELGEKFFFEKLKIPIENYFHFLEYCNSIGIEQLYINGKILNIIKIFQKESILYLKIINE